MRHSVLAALLLIGCADPDLTEARAEQERLSRQVEELRRTIRTLRSEMKAADFSGPKRTKSKGGKSKAKGKAKAQSPKGKLTGNQVPQTRLEQAAFPVTITRTGEQPVLAPIPAATRTETTCGYELRIPMYAALSDYQLKNRGLGKSGPIEVFIGDKELTGHAFPDQYEEKCAGAFRHAGFKIFFSPFEKAEFVPSQLRVRLSEQIPLARGEDNRPMYWVYPGTTLTVGFPKWAADRGESRLDLSVHTIGESNLSGTIQIGEQSLKTRSQTTTYSEVVNAEGGLELTIKSPPNGPYFVLDLLTLGNSEQAAVITGRKAWKEQLKQGAK